MEKRNGCLYDDKGNNWSLSKYTEEQIIGFSQTLTNCSNCFNCSNCSNCFYCYECSNCSDCSDCSNCDYCSDCSNCSNCDYCFHCSGCSDCSDCSRCSRCSNCYDCSNCDYCSGCSSCSNCFHCSDCFLCSHCSHCDRCANYEENPMSYTGNRMGSREGQTTTYWNNDRKTTVICGCFVSSLETFEEKVKKVHAGNKFEQEYIQYVETVKDLIKKG